MCERHGTSLPAAAIAFPFTHPAVVNVTLRMRTSEQVRRNTVLADQPVPEELWQELSVLSLIRPDAVPGTSSK